MATSIAATTARRAANLTRVSISSSPATRAASLISRRGHSDAAAKTTLSWERKFAQAMTTSIAATTARRAANLTRVSISSSPATRAASLISRRGHSDAAAMTTLSSEPAIAKTRDSFVYIILNVVFYSGIHFVKGFACFWIGYGVCKYYYYPIKDIKDIKVKVVMREPAK